MCLPFCCGSDDDHQQPPLAQGGTGDHHGDGQPKDTNNIASVPGETMKAGGATVNKNGEYPMPGAPTDRVQISPDSNSDLEVNSSTRGVQAPISSPSPPAQSPKGTGVQKIEKPTLAKKADDYDDDRTMSAPKSSQKKGGAVAGLGHHRPVDGAPRTEEAADAIRVPPVPVPQMDRRREDDNSKHKAAATLRAPAANNIQDDDPDRGNDDDRAYNVTDYHKPQDKSAWGVR
ncbi:hypothetical protein BS78_10G134000 [Paspalum vaginatum]|nr:hypothetical protein BS78_10G134000 [Paspalum vaginatum]